VTQQVDVRVIATTNRNLLEWVKQGKFREDLFYRLNVVPIQLPPVRERLEDVPALCEHFLQRIAARDGRPARHFEPRAMEILQKYHWPGNVRELENYMRRLLIFQDSRVIASELRGRVRGGTFVQRDDAREPDITVSVLDGAMKDKQKTEIDAIVGVLDRTRWNRRHAAQILNIDYKALLYRMKKLGIEEANDVMPRRAVGRN